jgi:sodium-dependent dicarboxylate transporter 2/3/5
MSEAVPVAWTALLIPLLAVLLGISPPKKAFAGFGDPILFLFFGTFLLTTAAFDHGLQARLAHAVVRARRVRNNPALLLWAVALLGCGLSAWVNNTATTAMLLPLALTAEGRVPRPLLVGVLLMSAYAPSLGGVATPVGTAPNLIGLRLLEAGTDAQISFARWCMLFAPLAVLFTLLAGAAVTLRTRTWRVPSLPESHQPAREAVPPGPWSRAEKTLVPLYLAVIFLWLAPGSLMATRLQDAAWVREWGTRLPETCVPLLGGLALFLLPAGGRDDNGHRRRILDASVLPRLDWSTLLLFGGGLSLGNLMFETGLANVIGSALFAHMPLQGEFGVILAATLLGVAVSEVTSNTASASLVVPIVLSLAQSAGLDPIKPALAATVGCSFGFMLPVSTPPNALVYATRRVSIREMVQCGIWLDVAGVIIVSLWVMIVL